MKRAPLVTTIVGDKMNDMFEDACCEDTYAKAYAKGFMLGALDYIIAFTSVFGTYMLGMITVNGIKNKIHNR